MNDELLNIRNIGEKREDFQSINKVEGFFLAALDVKGEDRTAAVGEVFLIQRMVGVVGKRGVIDLLDKRMIDEVIKHLLGVLHMALESERKGFGSL